MAYATFYDFFPNHALRHKVLLYGDRFITLHQNGKIYKVGSKYKDADNFIVAKVIYDDRKWWQFWKKRKVFGYIIECIKD